MYYVKQTVNTTAVIVQYLFSAQNLKYPVFITSLISQDIQALLHAWFYKISRLYYKLDFTRYPGFITSLISQDIQALLQAWFYKISMQALLQAWFYKISSLYYKLDFTKYPGFITSLISQDIQPLLQAWFYKVSSLRKWLFLFQQGFPGPLGYVGDRGPSGPAVSGENKFCSLISWIIRNSPLVNILYLAVWLYSNK